MTNSSLESSTEADTGLVVVGDDIAMGQRRLEEIDGSKIFQCQHQGEGGVEPSITVVYDVVHSDVANVAALGGAFLAAVDGILSVLDEMETPPIPYPSELPKLADPLLERVRKLPVKSHHQSLGGTPLLFSLHSARAVSVRMLFALN